MLGQFLFEWAFMDWWKEDRGEELWEGRRPHMKQLVGLFCWISPGCCQAFFCFLVYGQKQGRGHSFMEQEREGTDFKSASSLRLVSLWKLGNRHWFGPNVISHFFFSSSSFCTEGREQKRKLLSLLLFVVLPFDAFFALYQCLFFFVMQLGLILQTHFKSFFLEKIYMCIGTFICTV